MKASAFVLLAMLVSVSACGGKDPSDATQNIAISLASVDAHSVQLNVKLAEPGWFVLVLLDDSQPQRITSINTDDPVVSFIELTPNTTFSVEAATYNAQGQQTALSLFTFSTPSETMP